MSDTEPHGPESRRTGIPRDLPDQEAARSADGKEPDGPGEDLPDTDEAGSGPRRDAAAPEEGEKELPEPQEPTD